MPSFEEAWNAVARHRDGEPVSPDLRPRLRAVYERSISKPFDCPGLKKSLQDLLQYLVSEGRTNANCWATDRFFGLSQGWERDWAEQELPESYHHVLAMMGEASHDTVKAPDIARNFGCLPEQLLERVMRLPDR